MSRKLCIALFVVVLSCGSIASAEVAGTHMLFNNVTEEQYRDEVFIKQPVRYYSAGVDVDKFTLKYYDSLSVMLLALMRGEIDYLDVPRDVGRYILENNPDLVLKGFDWWTAFASYTLSFGFLEDSSGLSKKFNEALAAMKKDGTLVMLKDTYIEQYGMNDALPAKIEMFDDAQTITAALTGDFPPIDYIAADGTPAGFNVAVLAEIGRRLHVNIKTIHVETGARLAALTSGRADVAFWFMGAPNGGGIPEKGEGLVLSEPYYAWNEYYYIGKK